MNLRAINFRRCYACFIFLLVGGVAESRAYASMENVAFHYNARYATEICGFCSKCALCRFPL